MDAAIQRASERAAKLSSDSLSLSRDLFCGLQHFFYLALFSGQEKSDGGREARRTRESFMAPYFISFVDHRQG